MRVGSNRKIRLMTLVTSPPSGCTNAKIRESIFVYIGVILVGSFPFNSLNEIAITWYPLTLGSNNVYDLKLLFQILVQLDLQFKSYRDVKF